jgi:hemin uptake protein HemP
MTSEAEPQMMVSGAATRAGDGRRRIKVSALLHGAREVILEHDSQDYGLRVTANGKLTHTKVAACGRDDARRLASWQAL